MSEQLARAFFERDLSEGEADALEASLATSPEAAEALLRGAEEHYRATGLPEPRWSARRGGGRRWPWLLAAVLLGGGALFALNQRKTSAKVLEIGEADGELPVVEARREEPVAELMDAAAEEAAPGPAAVAAAMPAPVGAAEPARQGQRLSVVLRLKAETALDVQVLDAQGSARKRLFRGSVPAGERRFEWDGTDEHGRRVPPGDYQVHISGPGLDLRRPLKLRAQAR